MAVYMLQSVTVTVNSVDYTDHLKSATLTLDAAQLDTTDFSSGGWTEAIGGLKSGTLALEFMDDVADNDVDEELFALLGTVVAATVKAATGAISTSNPEYQFSVLVTQVPLGGAVGALATKSVSWPLTGSVTRDVTA